ncbi:TIGR00269 family protein [Candidatus Bathyarchaeota archaeon]|nr:MAG: TIGR00269 family protein [Candidatus Bathyarchaeota archaeon]
MTLRCQRCGGEAVYRRPYSGEVLCRKHFLRSIEDRVYLAIRRYRMFNPDDRIGLALSGGKDSMTLLHILAKIEARFPKARLIAVTIDEGIRGYRRAALRIASKACKRLGVPHHVYSFRKLFGLSLDRLVERALEKGLKPRPCVYCGILRRRALNIAAEELKLDKIATAHNLDDVVQTYMLNLAHGDIYRFTVSGPVTMSRFEGIPTRVKPLMLVPEKEVTLYAVLTAIEFQPTQCPYAGSSLRTDIRAMLARLEDRHPGILFILLRSFEKLADALRDQVAAPKAGRCKICGAPTSGDLCKACELLLDLGLVDG